jgi:hypothetical protein
MVFIDNVVDGCLDSIAGELEWWNLALVLKTGI